MYCLWHLLFVIVALALLLPFVALPIINSVRIGAAPLHYAVYVSLMVSVPFLSLVIVWYRFRRNVVAALKFFYAVELPLMLLLLLRVVMFRDAPFAAQVVFANISLGITAYFGMLWYSEPRITQLGKYIDLILSTIVALVGVYLGLLLGLQFLPLALSFIEEVWQGLVNFQWADSLELLQNLVKNPLIIFYVALFFITAIFFLTTPVVLIVVYIQQFIARCRVTPWPRLFVVLVVVLFVETMVLVQGNIQPQWAAFALSETLPTANHERHKLLEKAETMREGLLNGYLASYRYLSTTGSSRSLKKRYSDLLGEGTKIPTYVQKFFNGLAAPFLYQGEGFKKEKKMAAMRYQEFFDTPIEKGERENILAAVKATWENEQNEAGLMNAASRYVLLKNQTIEIEEQGDVATITITQIVENQTYQAQEIVFHFALPEDTVITGLWMSDDIEEPQKFQHMVSPRGAAQSVYKSEVQRRIDPALLEQVGPLQYRMRAFPIPARVVENRSGRNRYRDSFRGFMVSPASVRFQYTVALDTEGGWPMPELLEKRNVYWDKKTIRTHSPKSKLSWLPVRIPASKPSVLQPHIATINDGIIHAIPRDTRDPGGVIHGPVAVIIDGSYSMNMVQDRLEKQLESLAKDSVDYDLFFCQETCAEIDVSEVAHQIYFGNSQLLEQLSQWSASTSKQYSAIFVLSDAGSYELSPDPEIELNIPNEPLWLVHLSEQLPYAYDDKVIDGVNDSRGGIAKTVAEAMEKFLWNRQLGKNTDDGRLIGASANYFWYWLNKKNSTKQYETDAFAAVAAGRWIKYLAAESDKAQLSTLDQIHTVAKDFDIVSYYSSMLVLVEDRQRQLLEEAEARDDRFNREVETGEETLGEPTDPFSVPGVPEPEEWALLLIAGCMLWITYRSTLCDRP